MDRMFRLTERQTLLRLLFHPATLYQIYLAIASESLRWSDKVPREASTSSEDFGHQEQGDQVSACQT